VGFTGSDHSNFGCFTFTPSTMLCWSVFVWFIRDDDDDADDDDDDDDADDVIIWYDL